MLNIHLYITYSVLNKPYDTVARRAVPLSYLSTFKEGFTPIFSQFLAQLQVMEKDRNSKFWKKIVSP